jgi:glycosyltransferase involved in cell wall biosynthesis
MNLKNSGMPAAEKPSVLMIAYACDPKGIGEYWLGWGWAEQAARAYQVTLITTLHCPESVTESARACGINVHFVGLPEWVRSVIGSLKGGGAWLGRIIWQYRAANLAEKLHREKPFALVHQTTFHTFRVPFVASRLNIPAVWGPVAGGEYVPEGFASYVGGGRFLTLKRKALNRLCLQLPPVKRSLRRASTIFVSNHTTLGFLPVDIQSKCVVVPPNSLRPDDERPITSPPMPRTKNGSDKFRLLSIGYCFPTRSMRLAFEALIQSGIKDYEFFIVGEGPALEDWKRTAASLGLTGKVTFTGKVPYKEAQGYYETCDVLVFPSLKDSGGSSLLEAMSRNLPIVCLDWAGPGEMVDAKSGVKVPVTNPKETVKGFAEALVRLKDDPELRTALARAAWLRSQSAFRWEAKFQVLRSCYDRLIKKP